MTITTSKILGVILAGGKASRMGGLDKGEVHCCGWRLIDHVVDRLAPQVATIIVAGASDYGNGLEAVPDAAGPPYGPVAGLHAAARWVSKIQSAYSHLLCVPVDMPIIRPDTCALLQAANGCSFAVDADHDFSALGLWLVQDLLNLFRKPNLPEAPSLRWVAHELHATAVQLPAPSGLTNVNTLDDVALLEKSMGYRP